MRAMGILGNDFWEELLGNKCHWVSEKVTKRLCEIFFSRSAICVYTLFQFVLPPVFLFVLMKKEQEKANPFLPRDTTLANDCYKSSLSLLPLSITGEPWFHPS